QTGAAVSALLGGAIATLSYGHLLWANAILSWIPMLLVLGITEPPATLDRGKKRSEQLREVLSATLVRDAATRLGFLNLVIAGTLGLVMVWTNQKYWQDSGVPLVYFGVLSAAYSLVLGFAGRSAALAGARYGRRSVLVAVGALPVVAYVGMASFFGWGGIVVGLLAQVSRGLGGVVFLEALNEKISSAFRATVLSMANLGTRATFSLVGPLVGSGTDAWGLPSLLSALGVLCFIVLLFLVLPLVAREQPLSEAAAPPAAASGA